MLNGGRSLDSGDTLSLSRVHPSFPLSLNEGRSLNPGDTLLLRSAVVTGSGLLFGCDVLAPTIKARDVPIEVIRTMGEFVGEQMTCRRAQRPGTGVVLRRVRQRVW